MATKPDAGPAEADRRNSDSAPPGATDVSAEAPAEGADDGSNVVNVDFTRKK